MRFAGSRHTSIAVAGGSGRASGVAARRIGHDPPSAPPTRPATAAVAASASTAESAASVATSSSRSASAAQARLDLTSRAFSAFRQRYRDRKGARDGLRAAIPSDGDEERGPRRRVLRRGHDHRDLLTTGLYGTLDPARER